MKSYVRQMCILSMVLATALPCASNAQERAPTRRAPAPAATQPPRDVAPAEEQEPAGLLLPAVQKAAEQESSASPGGEPRNVQTAPQRGIEPDEIDNASRATDQGAARPARQPATRSAPARAGAAAAPRASLQQMMMRLRPRQQGLVAIGPGGGTSGPTGVQARPAEPPKYEIADCGTDASPMICCHHEEGDGSSCNLFKILCGNAGGTAQGDGESAACSDW